MPHRIWILDSDDSFGHLLEDVFKKANFEVTRHRDPKKTLKALEEEMPDVLIQEYTLAGTDGMQVLEHVRQKGWSLPVILVSSGLDNDKIRDLIRAGANGIFIKPLNVFGLMKRTHQIIDQEAALKKSGSAGGGLTTKTDTFNLLGFHFRAFPCRAQRTIDFARKFYAMKDFKATMIVSGKRGLPFDALCEDFRGFLNPQTESAIKIATGQINESFIDEVIQKERGQGHKRATFILRELKSLSEEQNKIIYNVSKKEGLYKELDIDIRFLFCLDRQLDSLFDEGIISENLYILMGAAELIVPSFKDYIEDIPFIAQQLLEEMARQRGWEMVPHLDKGSKAYIKEKNWENNLDSLRQSLSVILDKGQKPLISRRDFGDPWTEQDFYGPYLPVKALSSYLEELRDDFVCGAYLLCGGDMTKTVHILDCSPALVQKIIDRHEGVAVEEETTS